jgi:uncharacterized protein YprB with RNaseH-like and TPR domain
MTSELARATDSMQGMDTTAEGRRRRQLARLRADPDRGAVSTIPPPSEMRTDRAASLARDIGGEIITTSERSIVAVESREELPPDLEGLRSLPEPIDPAGPFVFLDTETTGLGTATGTLPFLVGIGVWEASDFVVRQIVLPDHSDEPSYLSVLAEHIPADACLVTYNGRSFDWPLIVTRHRLHGRTPPPFSRHLDLLPLARTLWKHRLPDARLASVEAAICGVQRDHDLPGSMAPSRYLEYLRSGHGSYLRDVIEHNRQDVVSMALMLQVLARDLGSVVGDGGAPASVHPGDLGGLGRAYVRNRLDDAALACFDAALERIVDAAQARRYEGIAVDRARVLTRLGQREEAEGAWHAIALEGGAFAGLAWLHVAKHREHDGRDFRAALGATDRARAIAERRRLYGRRDHDVERDLAKRVPRLRRRLAGVARPARARRGIAHGPA